MARRLREAGAVILGKTNLSEWANFRSSHSSSGWSGRGGQTQQSLRARSQSLRIEFRFGRSRFRKSLRGGCRLGDRWLDRLSVIGKRSRRDQADGRPRQPRRNHSHLA